MIENIDSVFERFSAELRERCLGHINEVLLKYHSEKAVHTKSFLEESVHAANAACKAELENWSSLAKHFDHETQEIVTHFESLDLWPESPTATFEESDIANNAAQLFFKQIWETSEDSFRKNGRDQSGDSIDFFSYLDVASKAAISLGYRRKIDVAKLAQKLGGLSSKAVTHLLGKFDSQVERVLSEIPSRTIRRLQISGDEKTRLPPEDSLAVALKQDYLQIAENSLEGLVIDADPFARTDITKKLTKEKNQLEIAFRDYSYSEIERGLSKQDIQVPTFEEEIVTALNSLLEAENSAETFFFELLNNAEQILKENLEVSLADLSNRYGDREPRKSKEIVDSQLSAVIREAQENLVRDAQHDWTLVLHELAQDLSGQSAGDEETSDIDMSAHSSGDKGEFGEFHGASDQLELGKTKLLEIEELVEKELSNTFDRIAIEEEEQFERFSERLRERLANLDVVLNEPGFLDVVKTDITNKLESTNSFRTELVRNQAKKARENYKKEIKNLGWILITALVVPIWRTYGQFVTDQRLYLWLKRRLILSKGSGVQVGELGANRDKLRAMNELVALGCAARTINTDGETVYFPDELLGQLDDASLSALGGSLKPESLSNG